MSQIAIPKQNGGDIHQPALAKRRTMEPLMRDLFRWEPFRELTPTWPREALRFDPTFEVKETKDSFIFKADLPGVREQDLQMTVTGTRLTVSGKREEEKEDRADTYHTYERSYGTFSRSFTLPNDVDLEHLVAELKGGVLSLAVPKKAAAVTKKITVTAGDGPKT